MKDGTGTLTLVDGRVVSGEFLKGKPQFDID